MLEFYFENPITLNRLRLGPSGRFIDSFSGCLKIAGYSWWTARVFLRAADHIGRYAAAQGRDIDDLDWSTAVYRQPKSIRGSTQVRNWKPSMQLHPLRCERAVFVLRTT